MEEELVMQKQLKESQQLTFGKKIIKGSADKTKYKVIKKTIHGQLVEVKVYETIKAPTVQKVQANNQSLEIIKV